jgi:hypothetical protein
VAAVEPEAAPADQAINALAEVRASIDELDKIAGRLARTAVAHGASWEDIGSSLRLDEGQGPSCVRALSPPPLSGVRGRDDGSQADRALPLLHGRP